MSTEGSRELVAYEEEKVSFLRKDSEYTVILKSLKKVSKKAIEVLEAGMESEDEKQRTQCAKTLLDMLLNTTKEHNNDQIQRLIAHCRFVSANSGTGNLTPIGGEKPNTPNTPVVDFSTIRSV